MRKNNCNADYKTLTTRAIKYDLVSDLKSLTDLLREHMDELSRSDLVEIAKSLNNLMYKIEG